MVFSWSRAKGVFQEWIRSDAGTLGRNGTGDEVSALVSSDFSIFSIFSVLIGSFFIFLVFMGLGEVIDREVCRFRGEEERGGSGL